MGRMPWAVYLWPGLPHLWRHGAWTGLAVAVGFALLLNLALISSLIWTELEPLTAAGRNYVWLAVALVWTGSVVFSFGRNRRYPEGANDAAEDDSFREALDQYLQQNWYEAQQGLERLLRRNPRDVDARLMLATVLQHTGRWDEATEQLDRLSRIEGSRKWELEIGQQRQRIAEAVQQAIEGENEEEQAEDHSTTEQKMAA